VALVDPVGRTRYYEMLLKGMSVWSRWITPAAQVRLPGIDPVWAYGWLEAHKGERYSVGSVIGIAQDITGMGGHGDRSGMVCSEMVASTLKDAIGQGMKTGLNPMVDQLILSWEPHKVSPKILGNTLGV